MRRLHFTEPELAESANSEHQFEKVKPAQIFGPRADARLAAEIYRLNKVVYYRLREKYEQEVGLKKRDASFYEGL